MTIKDLQITLSLSGKVFGVGPSVNFYTYTAGKKKTHTYTLDRSY